MKDAIYPRGQDLHHQREWLTRAAFTRLLNGPSGAARGLRAMKRGGLRGWRGIRVAGGGASEDPLFGEMP